MKLKCKQLLFLLLALMVLFSGCDDSSDVPPPAENADVFDDAQNYEETVTTDNDTPDVIFTENTTLGFKEAVESYSLWFAGSSKIAKDTSPDYVIIFEDGMITEYRVSTYSTLTYGEMSNMTDDEITDYYSNLCRSDDISRYSSYTFEIKTDDSGNITVGENIVLSDKQTSGSSTPDTILAVPLPNTFPEGQLAYNTPNLNHYISSYPIYDVTYQGYFAEKVNSDYNAHYFVTKITSEAVFQYDSPT